MNTTKISPRFSRPANMPRNLRIPGRPQRNFRLGKLRLGGVFFAVLILLGTLALPLSAAEVVASGTFQQKSFRVNGAWKIVNDGGKLFLEIDEAFSTKSGPDLKFFLSPLPAAEVEGKNASQGSVLIAQINSNRGAQRYALPNGTDLSRFKSLLLHCEKYSKLWASSPLR